MTRRRAGVALSLATLAAVATIAVCSAGPAAASGTCVPGTVVAPIKGATFVNSDFPGMPFGTLQFWVVSRYKAVNEHRAFIQFDLPAKAAGCSLLAARLAPPAGTGIPAINSELVAKGPIQVRPILSPWDPKSITYGSSVTWSTQPKVGRAIDTIPAGSKAWDLVASLRRLYRSGAPTTYGLSLRPGQLPASAPDGSGWAMLVNKTPYAPLLTLTWG
jgi:hypothetical protein